MSTNTPATNETKQKPKVQAFNCNETNAYCKPNFGLPDVPRENISSSTTYIDLRNNSINSLNQSSFSGLSNVTTILLSNNNISEISSHTFQDQANLTYLDLGFNQIKSVDGDMWRGKENLKILRLTGNPLENITSQAFSNLSSLDPLVIDPSNFVQHHKNITSELALSQIALEVERQIPCNGSTCWLKRLHGKGMYVYYLDKEKFHRPTCTNDEKTYWDEADLNCRGKVTSYIVYVFWSI